MKLIPSVDILEGQTVRLYQGKFDRITAYEKSPLDVVKFYADLGYTFIHIVNLDRARGERTSSTDAMVEQICSLPSLQIQMGGGLRNATAIEEADQMGVHRFVVGTIAVEQPALTKECIQYYGKDRFTISLDVEYKEDDYFVKTHGWQKTSQHTLFSLIESYCEEMTHLLCTDVAKDGALSLPNTDLYTNIKKRYPSLFLQASGGISQEQDLHQLETLGVDGVIVGRAIHEDRIDLKKLYALFGQ